MKLTMLTCAAGPEGVARPGTVLEMPEKVAKEWIDQRFARDYDKERDRKATVGLTKPKEKPEE